MIYAFASMMLSNGEDILWVSNMLGQKNSQTTFEEYAQHIPKQKRVRGKFLKNQNYTKTAQLEKRLLESA